MEKTMILAANAGRARFFAALENSQHWHEVHDMVNQAARQRAGDLETDRMGPTSAGKSMHNTGGALPNKTYEPAQTPVEHATDQFARDIGAYLLQRQRDGGYDRLIVSAPPQFLGVLRQLLDPHVRALAQLEINKDYTQLRADELREQIARHETEST
jgi:protein required for attachment to host cells